ncbi:MAG: recombination protein RecR [Thermoguttaceae bacterium]|nr:recombination protein RecR [Thermoguttaceae bacterium]MBQ2038425.1 recombination protein RecR [Thermoguttaceae bacterium]MBQ2556760.1 recombination protein RecR [Thermoguttaceae bacterium]MBQ4202361.1 recombination protein RecR [Thermoguttaceae bacterium]
MSELTESVAKTMKEFERLPGVGKKSAERIVYHLLKISNEEAFALSDSIRSMKENVRYCKCCFNLSEEELCDICRDPRRDQTTLCVVEQPRDLIALEKTGQYKGLYHVLLGRVSPLDGVGSEQLTIDSLVKRVKAGKFKELIMATNPTVEGDGTALSITNRLEGTKIKITRLARGITTGSSLEFANNEMLADAISGRQRFDQEGREN